MLGFWSSAAVCAAVLAEFQGEATGTMQRYRKAVSDRLTISRKFVGRTRSIGILLKAVVIFFLTSQPARARWLPLTQRRIRHKRHVGGMSLRSL
jgi:hypothetical protein